MNRQDKGEPISNAKSSTENKTDKPGQTIWADVTKRLQSLLDAADYERWILDLRLIAEIDGEILIAARDRLAYDRVNVDHKRMIQRVWRGLDPKKRSIRLECWRTAGPEVRGLVDDPWQKLDGAQANDNVTLLSDAKASQSAPAPVSSAPEFSFDTLVVGPSNDIAQRVAQRIASGQQTGTPMTLIYGRQGTGKTHLLHALRNECKLRTPDREVVYLTAEEFMSAYHEGVKAKDTTDLKRRLRAASILLVDDLHRISGKPGTETELFQNLREVINHGGVVVLVADDAPGDIKGFSPRMRSELKGAAAVEIGLPDGEMRRAIVERLADHILQGAPDFVVSPAMVSRIVAGIRGPGRELCGAVWSLYTEARFGEITPTDEMLERIIRRHEGEQREPSIDQVKRAAMKVFSISKTDIESPCKAQAVVYPRQIAMYLCRKLTRKSYPQIAHSFGKRDHTTVLYAYRKLLKKIETDADIARDVDAVSMAVMDLQAGS
jgi:chromosomal replication initiator protein